ncbi:hypothetical protein [Maribacter sp. MAR_2009_72]|uniref:hypothetical protein n=1 Tax=Maribacter sp. MAR_2009_72 TaxID=1250050 RepID=UPI00119AA2CC|nr:hypothetical protein [Maribacter sp. MAR_2009_72]TVZ15016.1 hypothetical protein JM81_1235 [Maribacter sp. MAR_2009_72]
MKLHSLGILLSCLLFSIGSIIAQIEEEPPVSNSLSNLSGFSITGHSYPVSANNDVHKSFMVLYGLNGIQLELQGFYDTYMYTERFRSSIIGKGYINEKFYLLSGMDVEVATERRELLNAPYRLGFVAGAGYDVDKNFMIEVKSNVQLNKSNIGMFGESQIEMPSVYTVGSKWKF